MTAPLAGILVIDLSRVLAGPLAAQRLADLGARVIKVESPDGDPTRRYGPPFVAGEAAYFLAYNRGKEAITLDLDDRRDRDCARRMIAAADVVIENFKPGSLERFGLADALAAGREGGLVHASISGFGADAEGRPAFDLVVQAESGLMAMNGEAEGGPCRVPISQADVAAGCAVAEAVLAALFARGRRHQGARIDVSLIDALTASFGFQAQSTLLTGATPQRLGHAHPSLVPYQAFRAADADFVLAVGTDRHWAALLSVEGLPPSLDRHEWRGNAGRVADRHELCAALAAAFATAPRSLWLERLGAAGIPCGAIRNLAERLDDPTAAPLERTIVAHATLGPLATIAPAAVFDGVRSGSSVPPPTVDEHGARLRVEFAGREEGVAP